MAENMLCNILPEPAFELICGRSPLLVSMPHSGTILANGFAERLTEAAQRLPDTDWFIPQLYDFLSGLDVSILKANYSRYLIDLNRPLDDRPLYTGNTTGLFPDILFDGSPVYLTGQVPERDEREHYKTHIWQAYHQQLHDELQRLKSIHGFAVLLDAHSIAAYVPLLFDGQLPDLNWGANEGKSCTHELLENVVSASDSTEFSSVVDGRFKGGYITRKYGQPQQNIHAVQLELSQATYLDSDGRLDSARVLAIQPCLQKAVQAILEWQAQV